MFSAALALCGYSRQFLNNLNLLVWILSIVSAAFGALLPDLDASESKVKHLGVVGVEPFMQPATTLHQALGHRGMLHSFMQDSYTIKADSTKATISH